jgi:cytochrome P450
MAQCYEDYGPIFRITGLAGDYIFVVGPEANRMVLHTHREAFSTAIGWGEILGLGEHLGHGLLSMDGAVHADHRRMMNPAFAVGHLGEYLRVMQRIIAGCVAGWAARGTVDIFEEARGLTFAIAAETLAGLAPGAEVAQFAMLYTELLDLRNATPVQGRDEVWHHRRDLLWGQLRGLLMPKILERRSHPMNDALGMLVAARDRDGLALSDEQLVGHMNTLLVAGHETSTSLIAWFLYLLSQHPDYLARIREEQQAILGGRKVATVDELQRMKVLGHALSETERMYPPIPNGARGVLTDVPFRDHIIPAGAKLFYSIAGSHYLKEVWSEPEKFDPDRFAPPREEDLRTPYALVGFGGGPRTCIGINFAKLEIKALATQLFLDYDVTAIPGQDLRQKYDVSAVPINGINLRLTPRA